MTSILEKTQTHFDRITSVLSQFLSVLVSSSLPQMITITSTSKKTIISTWVRAVKQQLFLLSLPKV